MSAPVYPKTIKLTAYYARSQIICYLMHCGGLGSYFEVVCMKGVTSWIRGTFYMFRYFFNQISRWQPTYSMEQMQLSNAHKINTYVTHMCVSELCQWVVSSLVQVMSCLLCSAEPLPEPMTYYVIDAWNILRSHSNRNMTLFVQEMNLEMSSAKW